MPKENAPPEEKTLVNIVSKIDADKQVEIAQEIVSNYDDDVLSRADWEDDRARYYKLWAGKRDKKDTPWPGASNVCIPMLSTACNQFHSRSYQSIFAAPGLVKAMPVGGADVKRARAVEKYMNWQTLNDMIEYEDEFDRLLQMLPINGLAYKKLIYNKTLGRPVSENIGALDLVLPYRTKRFADARRKTHRMWLHYDELKERNEQGLYENFDKVLETPQKEDESELAEAVDDTVGETAIKDNDKPHLVLECHKKYDLGDGKTKPYTFTVEYDTETLLRVTSREFKVGADTKVLEYFTDYHFIPNPESGVYSLGFGHFLEALNEMAITAFNQIFDAGTISNLPFGFYGRRAGIKKRQIKLHPGLMTEVEDAKQVFFPNMQRVDQVLFMVLGLIQQYGEQFTSVTELMSGRQQKGVREPTVGGTQAVIEQGLISFSVMTKRIFRSLRSELRLLMGINNIFLPTDGVRYVMEDEKERVIKRSDFDSVRDIVPIGDPAFSSRQGRRQEASEVYTLAMNNPLIGGNPELGFPPNKKAIYEVTRELLEAFEKKNIDKILPELPEDPVSPELENAKFMQGDYTEPKQGEDHANHAQVHGAFSQSEYYNSITPEYQGLLERHLEETKRVAYMDEAQAQQLGEQGAGNADNRGNQVMAAGPGNG